MRPISLIFRSFALVSISSLAAVFPPFSSPFYVASLPTASVRPDVKTIIWQDPGAVEQLDFVGGPGGRENAPKPPFTFVEETLSGSNPKMKVTDATGTTWRVKWGDEVNAEVFATRLVWAAGYFVDPSYYVASGRIEGVRGLKRAQKYVRADGSFTDARFERSLDKDAKELDGKKGWRWDQNPLVGSPELNGLKVLMMLTSNWDNKDVRDVGRGSNTAILEINNANRTERRYLISDWGGSMGKWGGVMGREKWDAKGYEKQTPDFIKGVERGYVEFGYAGQHTTGFKDGISVKDVKWLYGYVGRITDQQLRDGLNASGATPDEVERFTRSIRARIDQMGKL